MGEIVFKIAVNEEERSAHFDVRHQIFVEEQRLFHESDVDEHDEDAILLIAVDARSGAAAGAVRCVAVGDDVWYGGRLAVLPAYRRHRGAIGANLCRLAEATVIAQGCLRFLALIQMQNVRFFEHLGWAAIDEPVIHYGERHQTMSASLAAAPYPIDRPRTVRDIVHA